MWKMTFFTCLLTVWSLQIVNGVFVNVAFKKAVYTDEMYDKKASILTDGEISYYGYLRKLWFVIDLLEAYTVEYTIFHLDLSENFTYSFSVDLTREPVVANNGTFELCNRWSGRFVNGLQQVRVNCTRKDLKARYLFYKDKSSLIDVFRIRFVEIEVFVEKDIDLIYMGCYGGVEQTESMDQSVANVEECKTACRTNNFLLTLIKSGSECFCSNDLPKLTHASSECSLKCSADNNTCGSTQLYSAYQTKILEYSTVKHLSCYHDSNVDRDLKYKMQNDGLTVEMCQRHCSEAGFRYAAIQNQSFCFCGDFFGKYGESRACTSRCAGNSDQLCGGTYSNDVYEICSDYEGLLDTCSAHLYHCADAKTPATGKRCVGCLAGWKGPSCSLRKCSESNGGCGSDKCEVYTTGNLRVEECVCTKGFYRKTYNDQCRDIDECEEKKSNCDLKVSLCVNTKGSHKCECLKDGSGNCLELEDSQADLIGGVMGTVLLFTLLTIVIIFICFKCQWIQYMNTKRVSPTTTSHPNEPPKESKVQLSSGNLNVIHAPSGTKEDKFMIAVTPSSLSKQDLLMLLSQQIGVLILVDCKNQSKMKQLMNSLKHCNHENFKNDKSSGKFVDQDENKLGHIIKINVKDRLLGLDDELYEEIGVDKKVIHVLSPVKQDVIQYLYGVNKGEEESICILDRENNKDANFLVYGMNLLESMEKTTSSDASYASCSTINLLPEVLRRKELFEVLYKKASEDLKKQTPRGDVESGQNNFIVSRCSGSIYGTDLRYLNEGYSTAFEIPHNGDDVENLYDTPEMGVNQQKHLYRGMEKSS